MRIGFGYDVHAFEEGNHLVIGGIKIPYHKKFKAHSDGDVLLHSICDALLGAAALGDIGTHFPDTDPAYHNINSVKLLQHTIRLIETQGYAIENIDATIALEKPKLLPHIMEMRQCIAIACGLELNQVSVKATTTEKLGFVGEQKGAEAYAVVMLR